MKPTLFLAGALLALPATAQQQVEPRIPAPKYNDVMTAVVMGELASVRDLLALGKWPDKPDSQGRTPLIVALDQGKTEIAAALMAGGADPDRSRMAARRMNDPRLLAGVDGLGAPASVGATRK